MIEEFFKKEEKVNDAKYNEKVFDWIKSFEDISDNNQGVKNESETVDSDPEYFNFVPIFTTSKKINPKYYLTGDTSCKVYEEIDGKKSINQISIELCVNQNQVYNICKNLIKMGFISLN